MFERSGIGGSMELLTMKTIAACKKAGSASAKLAMAEKEAVARKKGALEYLRFKGEKVSERLINKLTSDHDLFVLGGGHLEVDEQGYLCCYPSKTQLDEIREKTHSDNPQNLEAVGSYYYVDVPLRLGGGKMCYQVGSNVRSYFPEGWTFCSCSIGDYGANY